MGNDVDLWEIAKICGKWLKYLINGLSMWEMHGARLKYLRNGFTMLEMALEFDERLKYVGIYVYMC